MTMKKYNELIQFETFEDRFEYLKMQGDVGKETFGFDRYLNQKFYKSEEWKKVRNDVIVRDKGNDLGIKDREIKENIIVHHIKPLLVFLLQSNLLLCKQYYHYVDILYQYYYLFL